MNIRGSSRLRRSVKINQGVIAQTTDAILAEIFFRAHENWSQNRATLPKIAERLPPGPIPINGQLNKRGPSASLLTYALPLKK